jgi:hypothetical protein
VQAEVYRKLRGRISSFFSGKACGKETTPVSVSIASAFIQWKLLLFQEEVPKRPVETPKSADVDQIPNNMISHSI